MNLILEPHFAWLQLRQPSAHYGEGLNSEEGHWDFIVVGATITALEADDNSDTVRVIF